MRRLQPRGQAGRLTQAITQFQKAIAEYQTTLRLRPDFEPARQSLQEWPGR